MILQHFDKYNLFDKYKGDVSEAIRCLELFFDKETNHIGKETNSLLDSLNNLKYDESYIVDLKLDNSWKQAIDYVSKIDFVDYVKDRIYEEYEHKYERTFEEDHPDADRWMKEAIERMEKEKEKERERLEELQRQAEEEERQAEEEQLENIDTNLPEAIDDAEQREAEEAARQAEEEAERARQEAERTRTQQAAEAAERARQEAERARAEAQARAEEGVRRLEETAARGGQIEDPDDPSSMTSYDDIIEQIRTGERVTQNPDRTLTVTMNGEEVTLRKVSETGGKATYTDETNHISVVTEPITRRTGFPPSNIPTGEHTITGVVVVGAGTNTTITKNNDGSVTTTQQEIDSYRTVETTRTDTETGTTVNQTQKKPDGTVIVEREYVNDKRTTGFEQEIIRDKATGTTTYVSTTKNSDGSTEKEEKEYNSAGKKTKDKKVWENPLTGKKGKEENNYDPETGENIRHEDEEIDADGQTRRRIEEIINGEKTYYETSELVPGRKEYKDEKRIDVETGEYVIKTTNVVTGDWEAQLYDRNGNPIGNKQTGNNNTGGSGESSDSGGDSSGE